MRIVQRALFILVLIISQTSLLALPTRMEDLAIEEEEKSQEEGLYRRIISNDFVPTSNRIKVAIFDADGTLRVAPSGKVSANGKGDFFLLPFVTEAIAELNRAGYFVAVMSNQNGIGKYITKQVADNALQNMRKLMLHFNRDARVHYFDFAEGYDEDRKPNLGMIWRLERKLRVKFATQFPGIAIDKSYSFVCGDAAYKKGQMRPPFPLEPHKWIEGDDMSDSDRMLAENYEIMFIDPAIFLKWHVRNGPIRFKKKSEIDAYFRANRQYFVPNVSCPRDLRSTIPDSEKRRD